MDDERCYINLLNREVSSYARDLFLIGFQFF